MVQTDNVDLKFDAAMTLESGELLMPTRRLLNEIATERDYRAKAKAANTARAYLGDLDLYRICTGHLSHYATLASNASGLMPPRYEWRLRVL